MVNVAIAGGNGAVGKTIFEVLSEGNTSHMPFVLSRQASDDPRALRVDYDDFDSLVHILEANEIHTIICAFGITGTSLSTSQMNLIKAADKSKVTKRFIPTSFAMHYPRSGVQVLPPLQAHFDCLDALAASNLEWSIVSNGIFMDYYGMPHIKSNLKPEVICIDIANKIAALPGDGKTPVTFTYSYDVARFVVKALDLEKWPREMRIVGETLNYNEFLGIVEDVAVNLLTPISPVGSKFDTVYDPIEKLQSSQVTELPGHEPMYAIYGREGFKAFVSIFELWMAEGRSEIQREGSLNEKFPDLKPTGVRELVERSWGR